MNEYVEKVREQWPHLFEPVLTPEQIVALDKLETILAISKHHPSIGVDKGWSYYRGGMADTGEWYFRKMAEVDIAELQSYLLVLEQQEEIGNKSAIERQVELERRKDLPLTEQDRLWREDQQKEKDAWAQIVKDTEHYLMWGKPPEKK